MESIKRSTAVLIGIGLVLVGLMAGVLGMLLLDEDPAAAPATRIVERIQLGRDTARRAARPPAPAPDSGLSVAVTQPARLNALFKEAASRVTPAVVYIQVEMGGAAEDAEEDREDGPQPFFRGPAPRRSVGSGVIISPAGYVVTNHHVVKDARTIRIVLADKRRFEAEVVGTDPSTDLAVLRAARAVDLPSVTFGDSDAVEVGEWVVAIGNPFRLTSTVTAGIVSALGRQVNIIDDSFRIEDFIQTDAAINPGNSGGALVNLQGELVGISTAIATESGSYEGYGFAVPSNLMERVVRDLIEYGDVRRGFLGVTIQEIGAQEARQLGLAQIRGVYIGDVRAGGAAAQAGVQGGDIVLAIDGKPVNAPNELQSVVASHRPGDELGLRVWRQGAKRTLRVTLLGRDAPAYRNWIGQLRPDTPSQDDEPEMQLFGVEAWGVGLRAATDEERAAFGADDGAYLAYVEQESVASRAGLPRDVLITHIDEEPVRSVEDALRALQQAAETGETALLRIQRRDGLRAFYEVETP